MRALYASRQERLVRALRRRLDGLLAVDSRDGGMQVAGILPPNADDAAASRAAEAEDVIAPPLSLYHVGAPLRRGLHLGYAGVPEREITAGVDRLTRALERWCRGGGVVPAAMVRSAPR
jgi:GntR family transcriptional regulator/MocR family aminotransferase